MTARYIMTTRIINGIAETQIDPDALPCQRIAATVPSTRKTYISKTALADDKRRDYSHLTDAEFDALNARADDDMAAINDDNAMYR